MNIGHALKLARAAKGLSLDELASLSALSQSYLSMIESGKREPTLASLERIANALRVPTPILLFIAADAGELSGIDAETSRRLSAAALDAIRN